MITINDELTLVQGDTDRFDITALDDDGTPYSFTGKTVSLSLKNKNKKYIELTIENTNHVDANTTFVEFTYNDTKNLEPGIYDAQVKIYDGTTLRTTSENFQITVVESIQE